MLSSEVTLQNITLTSTEIILSKILLDHAKKRPPALPLASLPEYPNSPILAKGAIKLSTEHLVSDRNTKSTLHLAQILEMNVKMGDSIFFAPRQFQLRHFIYRTEAEMGQPHHMVSEFWSSLSCFVSHYLIQPHNLVLHRHSSFPTSHRYGSDQISAFPFLYTLVELSLFFLTWVDGVWEAAPLFKSSLPASLLWSSLNRDDLHYFLRGLSSSSSLFPLLFL